MIESDVVAGEERAEAEGIDLYVRVPTVMSGVRGFMGVTGRERSWYHERTKFIVSKIRGGHQHEPDTFVAIFVGALACPCDSKTG